MINSGPEACQLLRDFVKMTGFPITSTLMGLGAFPAADDQWLGMLGMHGTYEANMAMHDCDLMICVGALFDYRVTGKLSTFAPGAKVIHADIDPAEISKNRQADVPIVGDVGEVMTELIAALREEMAAGRQGDYEGWWVQLNRWRDTYPLGYDLPNDGSLSPQYVI